MNENIFASVSPLLILGSLVAVLLFAVGMKTIRPYERGVVEFLGRYNRTLDPGLRWVFPIVKRLVAKVDMREQLVDVPEQEVITEDNVGVAVDAVIYYEATDPTKLQYNVRDFREAVVKLAQTNLRNVIGSLQLDAALTSRETINSKLRGILDDATDKWGTRVVRVEIQKIDPPEDVTQAMHRQMKAERDRRAMVTEAEGDKRSRILRSEGLKESQILEAEGKARSIELVAEAEGKGIETVFGAIHRGDPTPDLVAIKYLEALGTLADGQATKIFLPFDPSGIMGTAAALGELLKKDGAQGDSR